MTEQRFFTGVVRKRHLAAWAVHDVTAVTAKNKGRGPSPVEEEDGLLVRGQNLAHGSLQGAAENGAVARF